MPRTLPSHDSSLVPSLKPSKTLTTDPSQYPITYPLQQQKHKHKGSFPKFPVLHIYIPSTTTKIYTQRHVARITCLTFVNTLYNNISTHIRLNAKIISLTCVNNLYNNPNINTKACCQNSQSYMCTYPLQKHKHKNKGSLPKFLVLHFYIPSKTTQTF